MKEQINKVRRSVFYAYAMVGLAALLYTFGLQSLMTAARTLPSGTGAFALLPGIIDKDLTKYFTFFFLATNIPFIILFYKKIKKQFMYRTLFFLVVTTFFGCLQLIPEVGNFFSNYLEQLIVKTNTGINPKTGLAWTLEQTTYDKVWPMLVLPAIAGALVGFAIAISWKHGGSTAGSDFVTYYFSTKKKKDVGTVNMIVSLVILATTLGIFIGVNNSGIKDVWFAAICGSIIYIVISAMVVNAIYPKYKKVAVEVHSTKLEEIMVYLDKNYKHAYRIEHSISRYEHREKEHIVTAMLLLETRHFVQAIKRIDPNAWICVSRLEAVYGRFDTSFVE